MHLWSKQHTRSLVDPVSRCTEGLEQGLNLGGCNGDRYIRVPERQGKEWLFTTVAVGFSGDGRKLEMRI